jgi:hypothetical protein
MIPYKVRALYVLSSAGMLSATDAAQAVNVSADGRGQVLLYPYYTTRADAAGNAYATLLSVVNANAFVKAVRVRFLEGKNSRPVLDFNLFLSPFDVWTAAVLPDPSTGGARVGTVDRSCILPAFSASPTAPFVPFGNFTYAGTNDDGAGTGLDRAKEGYFEIIEMATYASSSVTGKAVTHVNGVPPCGSDVNDMQAVIDEQPPSGGLFGTMTLLNVNFGMDFSADAVALANFYQVGSNYQALGTSLPDLTQASPPMSSVQAPNGKLYESLWSAGSADPVSAVLMHDSLMNEYVLDSATKSGTDWVVTMPTKKYYVKQGTGNATPPFQRNFNGNNGACDDAREVLPFSCVHRPYGIYDRDERTFAGPLICGVPPPSPVPVFGCWVANITTFANSNVLGSTNVASIPTAFQNGWLNLQPALDILGATPNVHKLINIGATSISGRGQPTTTGNTVTYVGLPVIGFAAVSFTNGTLRVGTPPVNVLSNYGGTFVHKTNTTIE